MLSPDTLHVNSVLVQEDMEKFQSLIVWIETWTYLVFIVEKIPHRRGGTKAIFNESWNSSRR